jgi:hypothetical protein
MNLSDSAIERINLALSAASYSYTSGLTHNFYHYPARFSPDIAAAVIENLTTRSDVVLDPFMGGGTTIIESLRLGRRVIGVDLNALGEFVTRVRTTPLSPSDEDALRQWAADAAVRMGGPNPEVDEPLRLHNVPSAVGTFVAGALEMSKELRFPRQQAFARCALLRLGQWALDCRDFVAPRRRLLANKLPELVEAMLKGLRDLVEVCRDADIAKNAIVGSRALVYGNAVGLEHYPEIRQFNRRPKLVFTSPPYPTVHVLYHRWQYRGRKETDAPYHIARVPDGFYGSYYTGGSRTPTGQERYFRMITSAFQSVRKALHPEGVVVQLVGFSDANVQLPRYLEAMNTAGFDEWKPIAERLRRYVPNRKWYAKLRGPLDASSELLLFHRPRPMH